MKLEGMHQPTSSRQPRRVLLGGRHHLAGLPVSEDSDGLGGELLLAPLGHRTHESDIGKPVRIIEYRQPGNEPIEEPAYDPDPSETPEPVPAQTRTFR
jgi:hypothetical protein